MVDICREAQGFQLVDNWQEILKAAFGGFVDRIRDHWRSSRSRTMIVVFQKGQGLRPRFVPSAMIQRVMNAVAVEGVASVVDDEPEFFSYIEEELCPRSKVLKRIKQEVDELRIPPGQQSKMLNETLHLTIKEATIEDWVEYGCDHLKFYGVEDDIDNFLRLAEVINSTRLNSQKWQSIVFPITQECMELTDTLTKDEKKTNHRYRLVTALFEIFDFVQISVEFMAWRETRDNARQMGFPKTDGVGFGKKK